jgi:hypothetical protein
MRSERDSADGLLSVARMERQDRIVAGTPAARDAGGRPAMGTSDLIGTAPWSRSRPLHRRVTPRPVAGVQADARCRAGGVPPQIRAVRPRLYDSVRRAGRASGAETARASLGRRDRLGESPSGHGGVQPTTCIIHPCRPRAPVPTARETNFSDDSQRPTD